MTPDQRLAVYDTFSLSPDLHMNNLATTFVEGVVRCQFNLGENEVIVNWLEAHDFDFGLQTDLCCDFCLAAAELFPDNLQNLIREIDQELPVREIDQELTSVYEAVHQRIVEGGDEDDLRTHPGFATLRAALQAYAVTREAEHGRAPGPAA